MTIKLHPVSVRYTHSVDIHELSEANGFAAEVHDLVTTLAIKHDSYMHDYTDGDFYWTPPFTNFTNPPCSLDELKLLLEFDCDEDADELSEDRQDEIEAKAMECGKAMYCWSIDDVILMWYLTKMLIDVVPDAHAILAVNKLAISVNH